VRQDMRIGRPSEKRDENIIAHIETDHGFPRLIRYVVAFILIMPALLCM
jgi:hypothetical protein